MRLRNLMLASCVALLAPTMALSTEADSKAEIKSEPKALEKPRAALCERATGSYLRSTGKDCKTTSPMRVYTTEDLERTGVFDTNAALRKMDPAFR